MTLGGGNRGLPSARDSNERIACYAGLSKALRGFLAGRNAPFSGVASRVATCMIVHARGCGPSCPLTRSDKKAAAGVNMAQARQAAASEQAPRADVARDYNFAADILDRNLKAGRAGKAAFIDVRGSWTYGQLADRVARFAAALRALGVRREERVLL